MNRNIVWSLMLCLLGTAKGSFAAPADSIPLDPAVRYGKLPNGFTYYLRKNDKPAKKIEMRLLVKAGTFNEDDDQLGLAHLLEHMGFEGTTHFPGDSLTNYFQTAGLSYGSDLNANTGDIVTNYWLSMPSGKAALLQNGLQALRDWAQELTLLPEDIDAERGAVIAESRRGAGPIYNIETYFREKMTDHHPMFLTTEKERHDKHIAEFSHPLLIRFYKDWYRPDLECAVIVGDIDVDQMEVAIKKMFSDLKMPAQPRPFGDPLSKYAAKLTGRNSIIRASDPDVDDRHMRIVTKHRAMNYPKTAAEFRTYYDRQIYSRILHARLLQLTRGYKLPFTGAYHAMIRHGLFDWTQLNLAQTYIRFGNNPMDEKQIREALFLVLTEVERARRLGFTAAEVKTAIEDEKREYMARGRDNSALLTNKYLDHFIRGAAALSPADELVLIDSLLSHMRLEDVNAAARQYLDMDRNFDIMFATDGKTKLPDDRTIRKWVAAIRAQHLEPYHSSRAKIPSLADVVHPASPAAIRSKTYMDELNVTRLQLENGVTILLKPLLAINDRFKGQVTVRGFRKGGALDLGADYVNGSFAGEIVENSGAGQFDKFELADFMQDRQMTLHLQLSDNFHEINGKAPAGQIEELMRLIYLYSTSPRRNELAFEDWKIGRKNNMENVSSNTLMNTAVEKAKYPMKPVLAAKDLQQVNAAKVYEIFRQYFSGMKGYTFVVTGDFVPDKIIPVLTSYLGALPAGDVPKMRSAVKYEAGSKVEKTIYAGSGELANARLLFPVAMDVTTRNKVVLSVLEQALHYRMYDRLREKEGGTYAPASGGSFDENQPGIYSFYVGFDSQVNNMDNMLRYTMEEFRRLRDHGIDHALFDKAKAQVMAAFESQLKLSSFWQAYLREKTLANEDPASEVLKWKTLLEDIVTLDDVNMAARRYLTEEHLKQIVQYPEKK